MLKYFIVMAFNSFRPVSLEGRRDSQTRKKQRRSRSVSPARARIRPVALDGGHGLCGKSSGKTPEAVVPMRLSCNEMGQSDRTSHVSAAACDAKQQAILALGEPPPNIDAASWWISKALTLPPERRNGWVVAQMIHEVADEEQIARQCSKLTFRERVNQAGLGALLDEETTPRRRCSLVSSNPAAASCLLTEAAQRSMVYAISRSAPTYISGIRCWAAFMDSMKQRAHFPATEEKVLQFAMMFRRTSSFEAYLKHLRWGHRFLRLSNDWDYGTAWPAPWGSQGGPPPTDFHYFRLLLWPINIQ